MGKGEIARREQFHLFPQCFQKTSTADKYFLPGTHVSFLSVQCLNLYGDCEAVFEFRVTGERD